MMPYLLYALAPMVRKKTEVLVDSEQRLGRVQKNEEIVIFSRCENGEL